MKKKTIILLGSLLISAVGIAGFVSGFSNPQTLSVCDSTPSGVIPECSLGDSIQSGMMLALVSIMTGSIVLAPAVFGIGNFLDKDGEVK